MRSPGPAGLRPLGPYCPHLVGGLLQVGEPVGQVEAGEYAGKQEAGDDVDALGAIAGKEGLLVSLFLLLGQPLEVVWVLEQRVLQQETGGRGGGAEKIILVFHQEQARHCN